MILRINTNHPEIVELSFLKNNQEKGTTIRVLVAHRQAEVLLPTLEKLLKKSKSNLLDIHEIQVHTKGHGFTSLRLGVVIANTLAYALNIPVKPVTGKAVTIGKLSLATPHYDKPPTITKKTPRS